MEKYSEKLKNGLAQFEIYLNDAVLLKQIGFLNEMLRWGARINLTSIRNQEEGIEKHLIDSLILLNFCTGDSLLDVGTGAGLPAIPLAIADPNLQVVSIESVGKKINFQKHIRRSFDLNNFIPVNSRIEDLPADKSYPLITARAFAPVDKILDLVNPLLARDGKLLLLRGAKEEMSLGQTEVAMLRYGYRLVLQHVYSLPFSGSKRQILEIKRI
jgi:16S rRNA (guanine527-N7)-methyltransferase